MSKVNHIYPGISALYSYSMLHFVGGNIMHIFFTIDSLAALDSVTLLSYWRCQFKSSRVLIWMVAPNFSPQSFLFRSLSWRSIEHILITFSNLLNFDGTILVYPITCFVSYHQTDAMFLKSFHSALFQKKTKERKKRRKEKEKKKILISLLSPFSRVFPSITCFVHI